MHRSVLDHLIENAARAEVSAFVHRPQLRRKTLSSDGLAALSFQFASELEARNIGYGDRVVFWAENSPEWVAAFYGCMLRGVISVPIDENSTPDFVKRVVEQTEPKLILSGKRVDVSGIQIDRLELSTLAAAVAIHPSRPYQVRGPDAADTVEIVFTSGTTATPKGVVITHENLLANLELIEREIGKYLRWKFLIDPLKIVCTLPLSHVFGQMMGIFIPQILGATVVFQKRLNPSDIIDTIKRERAMVLASVPRVLETLKHKIEIKYESEGRLNELRSAIQTERSWIGAWWKFRRVHRMFGFKFLSFVTGGATLDDPIENFWRRLGFAVVQGYGMTETAALISLNNPFSARRGSLGQVLGGRENVKLSDKGEIMVRGKNVSPGYWGQKDGGNVSEWLNTGDVGEMDETGRLYFKGREKEVIVTSSGLNIYPGDLEAALSAQPGVVQAAVVGVDLGRGPEPAAALIVAPGIHPEDVTNGANKELSDAQKIRHWVEWPEPDLPRTATQKVRKNVIAEFISQRLGEGSTTTGQRTWLNDILSRFHISSTDGLGPGSTLRKDLDLDSLTRVELLSAIEDKYQIDIDEAAFSASTTVDEIEDIVRRAGSREEKEGRFTYPRWTLRAPMKWIRPVFYELVIFPITCILAWVKVRGRENLSGVEGPVIFASNHVTYVDPALIMSAMPGRFRHRLAIAMDGERLRGYLHPPMGTGLVKRVRWFFTYWLVIAFFNSFPLPRYSGFRESFAFAGEAMDRGYNILIFPEGELTRGGSIQKFKPGIGLLANGLEAPIVPVSITGLYELRHAGQRGYTPPGSVTITFGEPIPYDADKDPLKITQELEDQIKELQKRNSAKQR